MGSEAVSEEAHSNSGTFLIPRGSAGRAQGPCRRVPEPCHLSSGCPAPFPCREGHRSAPSLPWLSFARALPVQGQGVRAPGGFATGTAPSGDPLPLAGAGVTADQPLLGCFAARGQPLRLPRSGHLHELPGSPYYIFHLARVTFFSPPVCCLPEMV